MTRYIDTLNAMPTAATTPAAIATLASSARPSLGEILLRPFRRARIAHELRGLDERMLRDIGVTRTDIDAIASQSVGGEEWVVVSLAKYVARKFAAWSSRRDAYRRLMSLDDRMLADIGISRPEIPLVVKAMVERKPESGFEVDAALPLMQWNLWRDAHKQLGQLDRHMLSDIGMDIDSTADALAERGARRPANANSKAPKAA